MIARMLIKKGLSRQCSSLYKQNRLVYQQRYSFLDQKLFNQDHYEILGVQPGTSKDEIKKQYYRLTKQYHPDINKGNEEKFKQINAAWDVLSDDKKRSEYDQYNGFFGHSNSSSSSAQNGQAFNPFGGFGGNQFGGNQFGGQNPFHSSGMGQNPFGAGSPFEQVDLNQLLKDLKKNGVKLEDMQNSPHFNEFNQMFGLNKEEPKNFKDKVTHKIKQEAIKMMLRKVQDKLEKEIQFHQQQKEKYQQQANGGYSTQGTYNNQQTTSQQNQNTSSQNSNSQRTNQTYYSNKPSGNKSSSNGSVQDTINKASDMFSSFFKKK